MHFRSLLLILFSTLLTPAVKAQAVEEPPIPVMIVCPYHEDSLRRAYEAGLAPAGSAERRSIDSAAQTAVQSAAALTQQVERSFIMLYVLLGLLALISLAALRVAYRLRAELQAVRDQQLTPHLALPAPVVVETSSVRRTASKASRPKRRTVKKTTPRSRTSRSR